MQLADGNSFRREKPIEGIDYVTVTSLNANSIRIVVTGKTGLPKPIVTQSDRGLVLSLTAPTNTTATKPAPTPAIPDTAQPIDRDPQSPQTQPTQPTAPAAQEPQSQAEEDEEIEIVVTGEQEEGYSVPDASTATRTDTPLRDIPQSIQVIPQKVIEDQQVTDITDALRNVSGVTPGPDRSYGGDFYNIRGFLNQRNLRNGFRTGTNGGSTGTFTSPNNIERVEVLKGPASVLYGQFEPGGIVNYVTKKPLDSPFYEANFTVGNYDFYEPSIDLSGFLTQDKSVTYRFNALYQNTGSFVDFVDGENISIVPVIVHKISETTTITYEYEYSEYDRTFENGLPADPIVFDLPISRNI